MSNAPVTAHENIPAEPATPLKNGSVILPETRLSLWAAILTLIGALALFVLCLTDSIYAGSFYRDPYEFWDFVIAAPFVFERCEALILLIATIILFRTRASGKSLKVLSLFVVAAALLRALFNLNGIMYSFGFFKGYYLIAGISPVIAGLFMALYAFKAVRKVPSCIIIGLLLGLFFFIAIFMNIRQIWLSFGIPFHIGIDAVEFELRHLYFFFFPPGIFLAVLSSKTAKP